MQAAQKNDDTPQVGGQRARSIRAVASVALTSLIAAGVAFVVNIIMARALGPEARGVVAVILQVAYIGAPLVGLSAERALLRKDGDNATEFRMPGRLSMMGAAVVVGIVSGVVFGPWTALAGLVVLVTTMMAFHRATAIESGNTVPYFLLFCGYQCSIMLVSLLLWAIEEPDWRWWAAAYFFPGIVLAFYSLKLAKARSRLPVVHWFAAFKANAAIVIATLGTMITLRLNRLVLPLIVGMESLGLFIVVVTATEPLYWLSQAMADRATGNSENNRAHARQGIFLRLVRSLALFIPLGALGGVALYWLLEPVFGAEYTAAKSLVLPLIVSSLILALYRQAAGFVLGSDAPRRLGVVETITAVSAIIIYPVAIYLDGAMGAAWGSAIVYAIGLFAAVALYPVAVTSAPQTSEDKKG